MTVTFLAPGNPWDSMKK